jgi:membrane protein required for colicin V production
VEQLILTWFDWAVIGVVVVSTVMGFARGLLREASSLIAFAAAVTAAYLAILHLHEIVSPSLPADWPDWAKTAAIGGLAFILVYILAAWIGGSLAKVVHNTPEIGGLDRIFGLVFGLVRGVAVVVLFAFLTRLTVPESGLPDEVLNSKSYSHLKSAAIWLEERVPAAAQKASELVKVGLEEMPQ